MGPSSFFEEEIVSPFAMREIEIPQNRSYPRGKKYSPELSSFSRQLPNIGMSNIERKLALIQKNLDLIHKNIKNLARRVSIKEDKKEMQLSERPSRGSQFECLAFRAHLICQS